MTAFNIPFISSLFFLVSTAIAYAQTDSQPSVTQPSNSSLNQYQQGLVAVMPESVEEFEDEFFQIYMLTKLTDDEEKNFIATLLASEDGFDNDYLKPRLVHWASDEGGSIHDVLPLFKKRKAEKENVHGPFYFFADRKSVDNGGVMTDRDWYTLCISEEVCDALSKLCKENNVQGTELEEYWTSKEAIIEDLTEELITRGIVWGRHPGSAWRLEHGHA